MSLNNEVDTLAADAAYYLIPQLERDLRLAAEAGGWPSAIADQLTISYENGNLVVTYPQDLDETINNLEYGYAGQPPRPVLRSFSYRADKDIKAVLANDTFDLLMQYEEVF